MMYYATDKDQWKGKTIYIKEGTMEELQKLIDTAQYQYPEIEDADKREMYEGMIRYVLKNREEVVEEIEEAMEGDCFRNM